jgi:FlaA1/EpsC-like NDP-sugar epimerase
MRKFYRDKIILVTGAAGTIGQELVHQLIKLQPGELRLMDNNESALFLIGNLYRETGLVTSYLGDVRDLQKLVNITKGVDLIFHAAAFKHVSLSEYNPFDAVQTNITGVKNVVQAAMHNNVSRMIFTSSDKAVNPTNVMGTSKLMGERIMTAANIVNNNGHQVFSSVRFGNVLGSQGSVMQIFAEQILYGEAVTITDERMTRFVMTIQEAAELLVESPLLACGGEVLVAKMPIMRITDLARAMIDLLAPQVGRDPDEISLRYIGAAPGEKLYEELMTQEESSRAKELPTMFAILPALRAFYRTIDYHYPVELPGGESQSPYISSMHEPMTVTEIKEVLTSRGVLENLITPKAYWRPAKRITRQKISKPGLSPGKKWQIV